MELHERGTNVYVIDPDKHSQGDVMQNLVQGAPNLGNYDKWKAFVTDPEQAQPDGRATVASLAASAGWQVGDLFKLTEDDTLLIRLCKDCRIGYTGGFANGWSGVIKEIRGDGRTAEVNYFHKHVEELDPIPLAAAQRYPFTTGHNFQVIDDDSKLVKLCQMRGIRYSGGFANGWTGTIREIDAEKGLAVVHYDHKPEDRQDHLPLAAMLRAARPALCHR